MTLVHRGEITRLALLDAACEVFAKKGYQDATVAEICKIASANIAALNYHFGGKAKAYREAWQYAFEEGLRIHPLEPPDISGNESPVQRLHAHVTSLLLRMNEDGRPTRFEQMRIWEISRPSGIIDDVDHGVRERSRQKMFQCLREIVGVKVSNEVLLLCEASILSQCRIVLPFNRRDIELVVNRRIDADVIRTLAEHIVAFSVAGISIYSHSTRHDLRSASRRRGQRLRND